MKVCMMIDIECADHYQQATLSLTKASEATLKVHICRHTMD